MNRTALMILLALAAALVASGSARAEGTSSPQAQADPGEGTLRALSPDGTELGPCPLTHTDVRIEVSGFVERTRVTHTFRNPYGGRIEAVYAFPLPEEAAVRAMRMRVGDRIIEAEIRKRDDAREDYEAAKARGHTASLLEQERPNIFTTSVANIEPGKPVEVTLEYVETLKYEDGAYRLHFPMTVGPRFIPGRATGHQGTGYAPDTNRVADASRITPPVAPPGRSGHDIALRVDLDAGVPMGTPTSPTHDIAVERIDARRARVALDTRDTIPNRDFVLRWPVSPAKVDAAVLTHRTDTHRDGYVTLMLQPNAAPPQKDVTPKEIVFVLDTSGSMYGRPMDLSKELMRKLIAGLHPNDTFAVLRYSDDQSALSPVPLANTPENRRRALDFVNSLDGEGGTDALGGVRAAFAYPRDPSRLRVVVFMSDGYIGDDDEILAEVQKHIGDARLFSFGVGDGVNRYVLEGMAREGRGAAEIVTLEGDPAEDVDRFYHRLESPYLTDISVDWGGLQVAQTYPSKIPDLFAGQPLEVHGRYRAPGHGTVTMRGKLAGKPFEQKLEVTLPGRNDHNAAIASVWARQRIADLSRQMYDGEKPELVAELTQVALTHHLVSKYTSFLAVEKRVVTDAGRGESRQVVVPVELPQGVSADRIFDSSLSLARFQPGDPELRVEAPADARAVTAVFPFGKTTALTYEPRLERWTARFLVPKGTAEGNYLIHILITLSDGTQERLVQPYTVDSSGPDVKLTFEDPVRPGARVRVEARQRFTEADRALHGRRRARVQILSDLARLRVTPEGGAPIELKLARPGVWRGTWQVPDDASGSVPIRIVAHDLAGNLAERTARVQVTP